ncbi:hypothetical protein P3T39_002978 [Kitasatospora sp. GP82]|nr:hypothetical protein [Kitasatospora sp. GP82]
MPNLTISLRNSLDVYSPGSTSRCNTGFAKADNELPNPSMKSFHPKTAGARLYANVLERTLQGK